MILLRIRVDGQTREHRVEKGHATLGSGPRATIRHTNAGWPTLAGTLVQSGLAAQLIVPGRVGRVTLRVGDELRIGRAEVALIGLLPPAGAPSASPTDDGAGGVTSAAAPGLAFGEYDQVAPTAAGGGAPTQTPPTPAPPTPGAPPRAPPRRRARRPSPLSGGGATSAGTSTNSSAGRPGTCAPSACTCCCSCCSCC